VTSHLIIADGYVAAEQGVQFVGILAFTSAIILSSGKV
jgi:hypothetical protein